MNQRKHPLSFLFPVLLSLCLTGCGDLYALSSDFLSVGSALSSPAEDASAPILSFWESAPASPADSSQTQASSDPSAAAFADGGQTQAFSEPSAAAFADGGQTQASSEPSAAAFADGGQTQASSEPAAAASSTRASSLYPLTPLYPELSCYISGLAGNLSSDFYALYAGIMNFEETISLPYALSSEEVSDLMALLLNECPELFQAGTSWTQRSSELLGVSSVSPDYCMSESDYIQKRSSIEALFSAFSANLAGCTDYQIELALHDYIITFCTYDANAEDCSNAYGALIGGRAKCDGRARALVWGLRSFGISASVLTGSNHAWVSARIGGNYYNVDPTYDDNEADGVQLPCTYCYFNVPQSALEKDPYPVDPLYQSLSYPLTFSWEENYHYKNGLWSASGKSAEELFWAQLQAAYAAGSGCISIRFESEADYLAAKEACRTWLQTYLNLHFTDCSITEYDCSAGYELFMTISFQSAFDI